MKNYNINLSDKDIQQIMGCIDIAVKQLGLQGSELIMLASKLDAQFKELKDKENGNDI